MNVVENEFHFLIACTLYNNIRLLLYQKASRSIENFALLNNQDQFIYLCKYAQKYLSQFIVKCLGQTQNSFI